MNEEYKRVHEETSRGVEMVEFLAHNDPSNIDDVLRKIDDLIDKFSAHSSRADTHATRERIAEQIRVTEQTRANNFAYVKEIVDGEISEFLIVKKNDIARKYEKLKSVVDSMRNENVSWINDVCDENRLQKLLSEIDDANTQLSSAAKSSVYQARQVQGEIEGECASLLRKESLSVQEEIATEVRKLKTELDADLKFRGKKMDSIRRRTWIAVEKRLWDIQQGATERKRNAVSEAVSEYRQELVRIFSRYLGLLGRDAEDVELPDSTTIDFESIWNRKTPPSQAYRVKFIQLFLERFGADPILARQLHNVLSQH